MTEVTIVVPAYNEAQNLPVLYERLSQTMQPLQLDWELIVVDDHSSDETFAIIAAIAERNPHVQAIRFARNYGSHMAITYGLHHAKGQCAIVLAADMQDPPELIPELLAQWRHGAQIVWAVRGHREGEKFRTIIFARLYYFIMRRIVGIKEIPPTGADFFLVDQQLLDAFRQFSEHNVSITVLIMWMGFRQATVTYNKQARLYGRSGWNLQKKLKLAIDSILSFSYLPLRLMSYVGFTVASLGFLYAGIVIVNAFIGTTVQGWSSLMVVVLVLGGMQMLMMGVLGEYLWRALDESRRRPRYLVEATTNVQPHTPPAPHLS